MNSAEEPASSVKPPTSMLGIAAMRREVEETGAAVAAARARFLQQCAELLGMPTVTSTALAHRLETHGASPDDAPFQRAYATAQAPRLEEIRLKNDALTIVDARVEDSARRESARAASLVIPAWPPTRDPHISLVEPTMGDLLAELRALRYMNEQLVLKVHSLERKMGAMREEVMDHVESTVLELAPLEPPHVRAGVSARMKMKRGKSLST